MNQLLRTVFSRMIPGVYKPPEKREPTRAQLSAMRMQQSRESIGKQRAAEIEKRIAKMTRQRTRRAEYAETFANVSHAYDIPRKRRRAIARDILKRQRLESQSQPKPKAA